MWLHHFCFRYTWLERLRRHHFRFRNTWVGRLGRHHFRFRSNLAPKFETSRLCIPMAAGAWPISRIGILEQTKECCLERGAYPFAAATATKFVFHPVWWPANTFDGRETTRVHQMEVLPTVSERSSRLKLANFWSWAHQLLTVLHCLKQC